MPQSADSPDLQRKSFLLLLILVSVAFLAILFPFFGAVFWGGVLALLFAPVQRRLRHRWPKRRNLTAFATLSLILFLVILPVSLVTVSLIRQATAVYARIRSGISTSAGMSSRCWARCRNGCTTA